VLHIGIAIHKNIEKHEYLGFEKQKSVIYTGTPVPSYTLIKYSKQVVMVMG
jgi:hypothetical protein